MTNATDALRALPDQWDEFAAKCIEPAAAHAIKTCASELRLRLATPAGSASGEVQRYFRGEYGMVAAGPEYPHRDGDTYWVAEQDYAALQAEVARHKEYAADAAAAKLAAELAQRRTEAEAARLRELLRRAQPCVRHTAGNVAQRLGMDYAKSDYELLAAIDAAMGSANGQG